MKTAEQIYKERFAENTGRTPRSAAYKRGMHDQLVYKLQKDRGDIPPVPHPAGSVEFDAYFAGIAEANSIVSSISAKL